MTTLRTAINLARTGRQEKACEILRDLTQARPQDFYAWLWLAECSLDTHEATKAIQHALALRPNHARARELHSQLVPSDNIPFRSSLYPATKISPTRNYDPERRRFAGFLALALVGAIGLTILAVLLLNTDNANSADDTRAENITEKQEDAPHGIGDKPEPAPASIEDAAENWLMGVLTGEDTAAVNFGCNDDPHTVQLIAEHWSENFLETGLRALMDMLYVDTAVEFIGWVDDTAEVQADGHFEITLFGKTFKSSEFSVILRAVTNEGKWAICGMRESLQ